MNALMRARTQTRLVQELGEKLRAMGPGAIGRQRLDGMPHARAFPQGLDVQLEKRESLTRICKRESALLRKYEKQARAVMEVMKPEWYAFSVLYYLGGLSVEETAEALDRSVRQCMRYKREIEAAETVTNCQLGRGKEA